MQRLRPGVRVNVHFRFNRANFTLPLFSLTSSDLTCSPQIVVFGKQHIHPSFPSQFHAVNKSSDISYLFTPYLHPMTNPVISCSKVFLCLHDQHTSQRRPYASSPSVACGTSSPFCIKFPPHSWIECCCCFCIFILIFGCTGSQLWCAGSSMFLVTCELFLTGCGIQFPDQASNLGPCIGSAESQPLDHQENLYYRFLKQFEIRM